MAIVWFVQDVDIQVAFPIARKPLEWCIKKIGLRPENWRPDLKRDNLTVLASSRTRKYQSLGYVVVEIDQEDFPAGDVSKGWKHGFHLLGSEAILTEENS